MPSRARLVTGHLMALLLLSALGVSAAAGEAVAEKTGYTVVAGDLLEIQVFNHPELLSKVRISAEGDLLFPLIGRVPGVLGMRDVELVEELTKRLQDGFLPQAMVSVVAIELAPRRAHILGSVARQGSLELSPYVPLTASQGISECGGFSEDADQAGVRVLRPAADGSVQEAIAVPSPADIAQGKPSPLLRPGDLVLVPRLDRVYILGRVARPGPVSLRSQERMTVSKAISVAGGFEKFALKGEVQFLRAGEAARRVDVQAYLDGKSVDDPELRNGDSIYVPESRF